MRPETDYSISFNTSPSGRRPPFVQLYCVTAGLPLDASERKSMPRGEKKEGFRMRVVLPDEYADEDNLAALTAIGYDAMYLDDLQRFSDAVEEIINGSPKPASVQSQLGKIFLKLRLLDDGRGYVSLSGVILSHLKNVSVEARGLSKERLDYVRQGVFISRFAFLMERTYLYESLSQSRALLKSLIKNN